MYYWLALVFLRDELILNHPASLSLEHFASALGCTKRNAQLVIKKLVGHGFIDWQPAVGRGHLPKVCLRKDPVPMLESKARRWLAEGKVESAITLIHPDQRDGFLANYLIEYQTAPHNEDILQVPFYRGTHELDPINITRRTEAHLARHLFANLLRYDVQTKAYRGDLAQTFTPCENGLVIVLRKGLQFHNGQPITAEAVRQHYERLMADSQHYAKLYALIDDIKVIDTYRLMVISYQAATLLPKLLSNGPMGITLKDGERIIGSGPFALIEQTKWRTLMKTSRYYHGYRPWVEGVEVWNVGDKAKDFASNSHLFHSWPLSDVDKKQYDTKAQWELGCVYTTVNANRKWGQSKARRLAFMALLNALGIPPALADKVVKADGMMTASTDITPVNTSQIDTLAAQLREHIKEPVRPLRLLTYQLPMHQAYGQHFEQKLNQLGIACELCVLEFPDFNRKDTFDHADVIISGEVFEDDIDLAWLDWFLSCLNLNRCLTEQQRHWLTEQLAHIYPLEEAQRLPAYRELEAKLIAKGLYLPGYHVQQHLVVAKGVTTSDMLSNGWVDFSQVIL